MRTLGIRAPSGPRVTGRRLVLAGAIPLALTALAACGSAASGSAASSSAASGAASTATGSSSADVASWCGPKPVILGYLDGNGANAWSQESLQQAKLAASECKSIRKVLVVDAHFNVQAAITGLTSLVARGANAIVIVPDAGASAELPGIISATRMGVKVVPWAVDPGGSAPQDYVDFLNYDTVHNGVLWAQWLVNALHGKGNVVYLGGPPGNPIDVAQLTGVTQVLRKYPSMHLLTGYSTTTWPVTNWDPAAAQTVTAGLLSKYSGTTINGLITGDGQSTLGAITAFKDAHLPIPDIAGQESNGLACAWKAAQGTSSPFQLATSSNRNWMAQVAVMKAVAQVNGLTPNIPNTFELPLYEDSLQGGSMTPNCDESVPMSDLTSSILRPLSFWLAHANG